MRLLKMQVDAIVSEVYNKQRDDYNKKVDAIKKQLLTKPEYTRKANEIVKAINGLIARFPEVDAMFAYEYNKEQKRTTNKIKAELIEVALEKQSALLEEPSRDEVESKVIIASIDAENYAQLKKIFGLK